MAYSLLSFGVLLCFLTVFSFVFFRFVVLYFVLTVRGFLAFFFSFIMAAVL